MKLFFRFLTVGVFNTIFGYAVIFLCMYVANLSAEKSNIVGYSIGLFISYILNKNYTFKSKHSHGSELFKFLLVFLIAYGANYFVLIILIYKIGILDWLSQIIAGIFYVAVSFFMNKIYVFKPTSYSTVSNQFIEKLCNPIMDYFEQVVINDLTKTLNRFFGLTLIFLWLTFLWNSFQGDRSFALFIDNESFIGPVLSSMSQALQNGSWPFRMSTILGGLPLYNFPQLSAFYPFYLALFPIFNSPIDVIYAMHWITLLHLLIFEINLYVFIRIIGASRLASLIGAAFVAFSANSFTYAVWLNIIAPYSWMPLYLAGLFGLLAFPRSAKYFRMALAGIVLLTLASPAQPLIHAVFITIVIVSSYTLNIWLKGNREQISTVLFSLALLVFLSLLLVAPVVFPAVFEFKNMIRWIGPFPPVIGNAKIPFNAFQIDQLAINDLAGVFFKFKSSAVGSQFIGVLVIALASVAVVSRPKSWLIISLLFTGVYSLISSTGTNLGLAYFNYHIPLLNKIREPSRFLFLFQLCIGVLAALGIDEFSKIPSERRYQLNRQIIALLTTLFLACWAFFSSSERIISVVSPFLLLSILVLLILVTFSLMGTKFNKANNIIGLLWGVSALFMLKIDVPWIPPSVSNSQYLSSDYVSLDKVLDKIIELDPGHDYRVIFDGKIDKPIAAMLASYRGIRSFNSYFNPAPFRQFEQMYYHVPRGNNYFRILGAKYLICIECTQQSMSGYKFYQQIAGYDIFVADEVLPHIFIKQDINGIFLNFDDFVAKASNLALDNNLLFLEQGVMFNLNNTDVNTIDNCIIRDDVNSLNHKRYVVQCKYPGVLVMNEFYDDAWSSFVDGLKVSTLRVNGNQIGIYFSKGSHVIDFKYSPALFNVALYLLILGMVLTFISIKKFFNSKYV